MLLTKRLDRGTVLRCERSDGSATWQKLAGAHAGFFPGHDLTHLAVETELRLAGGFYGLIARGWDIDDTTGKAARGPLPPEAILAEHIVGLLDVERGSGHLMSGDEFRSALAARGLVPTALDDAALVRIRARRSDLLQQWRALPEGDTLELTFLPNGEHP